MISQKSGTIVNMSSIAADIGGGGEFVHYAMSRVLFIPYLWNGKRAWKIWNKS